MREWCDVHDRPADCFFCRRNTGLRAVLQPEAETNPIVRTVLDLLDRNEMLSERDGLILMVKELCAAYRRLMSHADRAYAVRPNYELIGATDMKKLKDQTNGKG